MERIDCDFLGGVSPGFWIFAISLFPTVLGKKLILRWNTFVCYYYFVCVCVCDLFSSHADLDCCCVINYAEKWKTRPNYEKHVSKAPIKQKGKSNGDDEEDSLPPGVIGVTVHS